MWYYCGRLSGQCSINGQIMDSTTPSSSTPYILLCMFILYYSSAQYLFFLTRNRVFEVSLVFGHCHLLSRPPKHVQRGVSNMTGQPLATPRGTAASGPAPPEPMHTEIIILCPTSKIVCKGRRKIVNNFQYMAPEGNWQKEQVQC